ncbi:hypothetical protein LP419_39340 [Massilia sp. H-1]|nr:hypothetical protein LP419_39340 [Massilia sp. H-1]
MVSSAWTGSVWRAVEQNSGASGYFISGALARGSTTTAPNVWTLDFLAAALSAPNSEPYNSDPLSGASVQKIGAKRWPGRHCRQGLATADVGCRVRQGWLAGAGRACSLRTCMVMARSTVRKDQLSSIPMRAGWPP